MKPIAVAIALVALLGMAACWVTRTLKSEEEAMASESPRESPCPPRSGRIVRRALYVLIGAVTISSLLGIKALVFGEFDMWEGKLLFTTLCVAGACILSMASTEKWEHPGGRVYAGAGMAASILGFLLLLIGIWIEVRRQELYQTGLSLVILGTAGAHGAQVLRASLVGRYVWIRLPTLACAGLLCSFLIYKVWGGWRGDDMWRAIGVVSILTAAATILVTTFQRMSKAALGEGRQLRSTCSRCGEELGDKGRTVGEGPC